MTNWDRSKSKKLYELLGGGDLSSADKSALMTIEMNMDVSLAMATGNVSTWIQLVRLYDPNKSLGDQSVEFQRQVAVTAASSIGIALVLHGTGVSGMELTVGRTVMMQPVTKVLRHPFVVVPAVGLYQVLNMPEIAGPQYQSAMTGQPNIGGSALNKKSAKSWSEFFSPSYWGL